MTPNQPDSQIPTPRMAALKKLLIEHQTPAGNQAIELYDMGVDLERETIRLTAELSLAQDENDAATHHIHAQKTRIDELEKERKERTLTLVAAFKHTWGTIGRSGDLFDHSLLQVKVLDKFHKETLDALWFMHNDETLGLVAGQSLHTDGVNALRAQRDTALTEVKNSHDLCDQIESEKAHAVAESARLREEMKLQAHKQNEGALKIIHKLESTSTAPVIELEKVKPLLATLQTLINYVDAPHWETSRKYTMRKVALAALTAAKEWGVE